MSRQPTCVLVALFAMAHTVDAADIGGFVSDRSDGESLPFVSVFLQGNNTAASATEAAITIRWLRDQQQKDWDDIDGKNWSEVKE